AIALTNGGGGRAITTNTPLRLVYDPAHPVPPVSNSTALSFATGTELIDIPLTFTATAGNALVANAEITGAGAWTFNGGTPALSDAVVHDLAGLTANAPLTLRRVLMLDCPPAAPCADAVGPNGALR